MASPHIDVSAPLSAVEVSTLIEQLAASEGRHRRTVRCDVSTLPADAGSVDTLARLELVVRRSGGQLRLRNSSDALSELIGFMGLSGVLRG